MDKDVASAREFRQEFVICRVAGEDNAGARFRIGKPIGASIEGMKGSSNVDSQVSDVIGFTGIHQGQMVIGDALRVLLGAPWRHRL